VNTFPKWFSTSQLIISGKCHSRNNRFTYLLSCNYAASNLTNQLIIFKQAFTHLHFLTLSITLVNFWRGCTVKQSVFLWNICTLYQQTVTLFSPSTTRPVLTYFIHLTIQSSCIAHSSTPQVGRKQRANCPSYAWNMPNTRNVGQCPTWWSPCRI